jgi:hypothetical protein
MEPGTPMPDDGKLCSQIEEWTADPAIQHLILVDNPSKLYGF